MSTWMRPGPLNVRVCNVPDYGIDEVADHAAAMAVFLSRRIADFDAAIRKGQWSIAEIVPGLRSLSDTTAGLIGFGRIARAMARRMQAFGCSVVAHDPFVRPETAKAAQVTLLPLDDVISSAQILSLHVPLIRATRHVIDAERLAMLPDQAVVINASRGGLIDEDALVDGPSPPLVWTCSKQNHCL